MYIYNKKKDESSPDFYHPVVKRNPDKTFEKLRQDVKIYVDVYLTSTIQVMNLNLVLASLLN